MRRNHLGLSGDEAEIHQRISKPVPTPRPESPGPVNLINAYLCLWSYVKGGAQSG
jgi:hypothetical protein